MIRTTPFHERTSALNETGLWSHWSGHLAAHRYQMSDKFEYFAVRNSAGIFDSSPLYKYRIHGPDAERFLAGVLARDIRACPPGHAQYTIWCDDRGFVVEDGVILRHGPDEFLLTAAEPNLAYFEDLVGRDATCRSRRSADDFGDPRRPGTAVARPRGAAGPGRGHAPLLRADERHHRRLAGDRVADRLQRRPRLRDLDRDARTRSRSGTRSGSRSPGTACCRSASTPSRCSGSRPACSSSTSTSGRAASPGPTRTARRPFELGLGWMLRDLADDDRAFIGRRALERELADGTSRWRFTGLVLDWARLRPDLQRGRADPAQGPHADRGGAVRVRRRDPAGRLHHELHVLADAPAAHRDGPRPARPRQARHARSAWRSTSTTATSTSRRRTARMPLYNPARKTA